MTTYRDLLLPDQAAVWRELRGLRIRPPGAAQADDARAATFQAALEQSQQLMTAASNAGYATRPIQLFYALSQGGRAIASVSSRLPTEIQVSDKANPGQTFPREIPWLLKGHGITAPHTSCEKIADVKVKADQTGLMPGVALALDLECLPPGEKIRIGDLWPVVPEAQSVPLPNQSEIRALSIDDARLTAQRTDQCEVLIGNIPSSVHRSSTENPENFQKFLASYPTLTDAELPAGASTQITWSTSRAGTYSTYLTWRKESGEVLDATIETDVLKGIRYRSVHDFWIFPNIGKMSTPLHPLLAWWAILFALSMLARYEPGNWSRMVNIDSSSDANAIEHLLDEALDVVPTLLLEAIRSAAKLS
ncbi:YaaC family protein [Amycolatopsis sp. SID8362]|uniref:YaaC family protein n=1 Tax=Amycolatopsis sp. SID8362 TaxID=2690346 RepID=UPI001371CB68|nr:YaaC family protein [Amycolatopsis sp. SID8362]NBH10796.1 hypothetical protein [Amycolatopsis sp. SID8362]NED47490.1 hypothetical protein [Amycolatopsis sp. SID8362]